MKNTSWDDASVEMLFGVGRARANAYAHMGIFTISDLVAHYPRAYEYRGDVKRLTETTCEGKSAVVLTVATQPRTAMIRRGMVLLKFRAFDESATCEITFFNQDYLKDTFSPGGVFRFYGKVERVGNRYTMTSPAYEPMPVDESVELAPILPVYPLTAGLSQKQVAANVSMALRMALPTMDDPLPAELRAERKLCALSYALRQIHCPDSTEALAVAKKRLCYDEFFLFALGLSVSRQREKQRSAPVCDRGNVDCLLARLPYALTGAQRRAIEEIRADMAKPVPMTRMVVGDVGCGKTVVAAAAMLFAVQSGRQAVLMAPTEILARQHAEELGVLFGALGIRCELLIGATPAAKKRAIKAALAEPDPARRLNVVIGTQALLSEGVEFAAPGLVVTDEQHRFGVGQRAVLSEKNDYAHLLVMSATPIPRSLALGLYGDLDISRIDEMPPGRQTVETFVVDEGYRERLNGFIRRQVGEGGQVYVVCPAIEAADEETEEEGDFSLSDISLRAGEPFSVAGRTRPKLTSALEHAARLGDALPGIGVACLHGKMKPQEKDAVMRRFAAGEVSVLVSTTVIEVGVNVPNACLMIIENAERFGLSQLHQLRGRVGRGKRKSYCVLVRGDTGADGEAARRRLETMRTQHDGFEIAKQDLLLRGPGDFLRGGAGEGIRQSGGIRFRLADQCDDADLLQEAFSDAGKLSEDDPGLSAYPELRRRMERLFTVEPGTLS